MLLLVVPTAAAGIHFVADVACMCSSEIGTVVAAAVLVPPDMHCSLFVGAATDVVVGVVATVSASDAGYAIVDVSLVAVVSGAVADGVSTWVLSDAGLSTTLICLEKTFPSPSVFSLFILVHPLFHLATFYAARACMHLCTYGRHTF